MTPDQASQSMPPSTPPEAPTDKTSRPRRRSPWVLLLAVVLAALLVAGGALYAARQDQTSSKTPDPGTTTASDPVARTNAVAADGSVSVRIQPIDLTEEEHSELDGGWPQIPVAVGVPVELSADSIPAAGIVITRRYAHPLPAQTSAALVYFDTSLPGWRAVDSQVSPDRTSVSATVHHLSIWTDVVGGFTALDQAAQSALASATSWLYVQVGSVFSTRVDRPTCPGNVPAWVDSVVTIEDAPENPLRFCQGGDDDKLVVKVTVNRGFGFVSHPGEKVTKTKNSSFDEKAFADALQTAVHIDDELGRSQAELFGGNSMVGAGETLTLTFDETDGRASAPTLVRMEAPSTLQFLVSLVARLIGTDLGGKAEGWVGAGLTLAQCDTDVQHADDGPARTKAAITCASGLDEAVARQIVNYQTARHATVDGAKIGGLVGRVSIYLALVGPVLDSMDFVAAQHTAKEARTASLFVKPPNVTMTTLRTAEVPAACQMPKQRLHNNAVGGTTGPSGQLSLSDPKPEFADIAGLGYKQAVSYYVCNAGGVPWAPVVVLTGSGGKLLGHVNLDDLTERVYGDRGTIEKLRASRGQVVVDWTSTSGCCGVLAKHSTTLRWNGSKLEVGTEKITKWSADGVASEIATAAVAGDRSRLLGSGAVPDELWTRLVAAGRGAEQGFATPPIDGETRRGDQERYELGFAFPGSKFVDWDVWMAPANNQYGWEMVSGLPQ